MNFADLIRTAPSGGGRFVVRGGQSEGHVVKNLEKLSLDRYTPSLGKGSEYAVKFRAEDDKAYFESMANTNQEVSRPDVTSDEGPSQMFQPEELTSIGTLPNIQELNREELTQVYQNYNFAVPTPTEHLEPIHNVREQILKLIEYNQVCIIKGPTGCGKSTQIPQFILDSYVERNAHCNIIVTQPRRIAAISIAQHVAEVRDWEVGGIVGYQVALNKCASEDTRLLYCTTGVLLEKLINVKHLNDYTHILLDEVHEREEDMDFAMLVIRRFLRSNSPNVRVILMSATMDVSRFANYFEVNLRNVKCPAPYYEIKPESKFTVQVHYLDALKQLANLPQITEDKPEISKEAYMLVPMMIRAFNGIDAEDYKCRRSNEEKGAVLIFLPGLYQIETLFELLTTEDKKSPETFNLWLCPLHSSITKDEQEKVRRYAPLGKRKVILSTNIAESSITIPDVKFVIDFCLTKHLVADTVTGFTSLQLSWASHTNCLQREGRVGRVQDGRVYRIVPKSFYQFKMAKESIPEMQRCPLELVVLKCKKLMEDETPLRLISSALDPPDLDNYEKTILKLKEIGALLITCRGEVNVLDGDLTFIGKVMAALPLDIHITKLILLGHIFDVLEDAIIIGCAMSVRNIFSEPFMSRLQAYNNKLLWADSSESDAVACLNAYTVWRQLTGFGMFGRSTSTIDAWSRRHMLQIKHLQEVAKQELDIKKRLKFFNIQVVRNKQPLWKPMEKPLILKLVLAGAFYPHYYSRSAQNQNAECEAIRMLSGHSPNTCVYLQNMPHPAPLYLDQVKECLRKNGVSDRMKFHHDDTRKLIVEFDSGNALETQQVAERNFVINIPGDIVMPVYRAIKLRQMNIPITIKTLPAHRVKEELSRLSSCSRSSVVSVATPDNKSAISLNQQHIEIEVCHVVNAGQFYSHILPTGNEYLRQIDLILNCKNCLRPITGIVNEDVIYAAPYKDVGEENYRYYRAIVKNIFMHDEKVEVFFIDYGNSAKLPVHELREVVCEEKQKELDNIPPCAVECLLAEVGPSVWSSKEGHWSDDANRYVTQTLLSRLSWYTQVYSYVNGVASVYLYLKDNKGPSKTAPHTLNAELRNKGYAREREESYFSKINHAKRLELEERGEYDDSSMSYDKNSDNNVAKWMSKDLMTLPTTSGRPIVELKGPNSPMEMKLFSMVRCSSQREVKVEWNSVNSILLDSDPSDPHERFLVAGSVSQSSDGRKLTLNHTTVLPNMHGLSSLICLIFAPTIELRTDDMFSRYTGALCGLGMKEHGVPLFPENDMEIHFDVEFTNQDLLDVNKLRFWINDRYCSDECEDMSDGQIIKIHKQVRSFTTSLLQRVRESIKVNYNSTPFQWGKIPEHRLFHPFPNSDPSNYPKFVYQLHHGIDIKPENDREYIEQLVHKLQQTEKSLLTCSAPRQIYCDLCDLHFEYCNQLRLHMSTTYHRQLMKWLTSRAVAHGINISKPTLST